MKQIKNKIYATTDHLHNELDKAHALKKELDFDEELGSLIATTTRIKILKEFIKIFKLAKNNKKNEILEKMSALTKRCKLHFYQLKKLQTENYVDNVMYFTTLMKVVYSLIINLNK